MQHARLPCPSVSPGVCSNSCPLSRPSNHLILCHPLLLLPSIFSHIRVFSTESAICIRWPKYWNFSFSISPPNEYSGLFSFRIDWFDLLAVQGNSQESSATPQFKSINFLGLSLLHSPTLTSVYDYWKNHSSDYKVSGGQQRDSAIQTHASILPQDPFFPRLPSHPCCHKTLSRVPCDVH